MMNKATDWRGVFCFLNIPWCCLGRCAWCPLLSVSDLLISVHSMFLLIPPPPFHSSLYQYHAKARNAEHSLHYRSRYHPSGWVCTSQTVLTSTCGDRKLVILRFAPMVDGTISPIFAVSVCWLHPSIPQEMSNSKFSPPITLYHAQVSIALYGFVIAATWIDFIAGE